MGYAGKNSFTKKYRVRRNGDGNRRTVGKSRKESSITT